MYTSQELMIYDIGYKTLSRFWSVKRMPYVCDAPKRQHAPKCQHNAYLPENASDIRPYGLASPPLSVLRGGGGGCLGTTLRVEAAGD